MTVVPESISYVARYSVLAFGFGAVVLLATTTSVRWLGTPWLRWIGTVSYGIYIIHNPLASWARAHLSVAMSLSLTLLITLTLAGASWYLFEQPILRLKERWPMPPARPPQLDPTVRPAVDPFYRAPTRKTGIPA